MGQQQLLLVILVTIIVGIATVVAINTFGSAADNANVDAVRNDVAQIAASAQGYYLKPSALGGGGQTFNNISFQDLAFSSNTDVDGTTVTVVNENGTYTIAGAGKTLTITARPSSDSAYDGTGTSAATAGATMVGTVEGDDFEITTPYTPTSES